MLKTLKCSAVVVGLVSMVVLVVQPAVFGFIAYHFGIPLNTAIYVAGLIATGSFLLGILFPELIPFETYLEWFIFTYGTAAAGAW